MEHGCVIEIRPDPIRREAGEAGVCKGNGEIKVLTQPFWSGVSDGQVGACKRMWDVKHVQLERGSAGEPEEKPMEGSAGQPGVEVGQQSRQSAGRAGGEESKQESSGSSVSVSPGI